MRCTGPRTFLGAEIGELDAQGELAQQGLEREPWVAQNADAMRNIVDAPVSTEYVLPDIANG
jgi:hypothetical protein